MTAIWIDPDDLMQGCRELLAGVRNATSMTYPVHQMGSCRAPRELAAYVTNEVEQITIEGLQGAVEYARQLRDLEQRVITIKNDQLRQYYAAALSTAHAGSYITGVQGGWRMGADGNFVGPTVTVFDPYVEAERRSFANAAISSGVSGTPGTGLSPLLRVAEKYGNAQLLGLNAFVNNSQFESMQKHLNSGNGVSYGRGGVYTDWDTGFTGSIYHLNTGPGGRTSVI